MSIIEQNLLKTMIWTYTLVFSTQEYVPAINMLAFFMVKIYEPFLALKSPVKLLLSVVLALFTKLSPTDWNLRSITLVVAVE